MVEAVNEIGRNSGPFDSTFDKLVAQALSSWNFIGLSIAVVDGTQDFAKGYGIANLPNTPVTPETLFHACSTTKSMCAAAVSLLVDADAEHENIHWRTPLSELIRDDFVLKDRFWTDHITLEDALSHRTGFASHNKCCVGTGGNVRKNVRKLRHLPASREPRTESQYCNIMFVAVSHAVEVVTGEYLGSFLGRRIWEPLGMTSTFFSLKDARKSGKPLAEGYHWDEKTKGHKVVPYIDLSEISGAGCNVSTVLDYSKWLRALIDKAGPVSQKGHESLVNPVTAFNYDYPPCLPTVFYGLGLMMLYYHGEKVIFHPGGLIGFSAMMVYLPQKAWGCVMMSNSNNAAPALEKFMWFLIDRLLKVPESEQVDWDDWYRRQDQEAKQRATNARSRIYPHASLDIPLSLPLPAYTGSYYHPAYPTMSLVIKNGTLYADVSDQPWTYVTKFEHVSGEYFLAHTSKFAVELDEVVAAEFVISAQGQAEILRVRFEESAEMIEFTRSKCKV